jgi:hypothetical protein
VSSSAGGPGREVQLEEVVEAAPVVLAGDDRGRERLAQLLALQQVEVRMVRKASIASALASRSACTKSGAEAAAAAAPREDLRTKSSTGRWRKPYPPAGAPPGTPAR